MSIVMQAKLLRVLQEGELTPVGSSKQRAVDVRVLAATSKNLLEEIEQGRFRDDLYDRLNVVNIGLPPLRVAAGGRAAAGRALPPARERRERLQAQAARAARGRVPGAAPWRGNVRELRNLMERLAVIVRARRREPPRRDGGAAHDGVAERRGRRRRCRCDMARSRFERQYILERLSANHGNLGQHRQDLGIERTNLYRKMKQLGIGAPKRAR